MKKSPVLFFLVILFLALGYFALKIYRQKPLPVLSEVSPFELTDAFSQKVLQNNLQGKIWVADFVFTRCQGPCPLMTEKMQRLHQQYYKRDDVRLVTITVDPEYDTPDILKKYAEKYHADRGKWHFLTGEKKKIENLMFDGFKLGFAENIMFHSDRLVLIDRDLKIRGYYSGSEKDDFNRLQRDLKTLL